MVGTLLAVSLLLATIWGVARLPSELRRRLLSPLLLLTCAWLVLDRVRAVWRFTHSGQIVARLQAPGAAPFHGHLSALPIIIVVANQTHAGTPLLFVIVTTTILLLIAAIYFQSTGATRLTAPGIIARGTRYDWQDVSAFGWDPPAEVPPLTDEWDRLILYVRYQPFRPLPYHETARLSLDVARIDRPAVARILDERLPRVAVPPASVGSATTSPQT